MSSLFSSPAARGSRAYFVFYGALAAWIPFINVYFRHLGLKGWQIGVLSALLPGAIFALAPPLTALADRRTQHISMLSVASIGLAATLLLFVVPTSFPILLLLMALLAVSYSPLIPLLDSTVARMAVRHDLNYGGMRLWGSFSFALISVACGTLWAGIGYRAMFVVSAALYLVVAWSAQSLEGAPVVERHLRVPLRTVRDDRFLILLLATTFIVSSAVGVDMAFTGIYMAHLGGNGLFIGLIFGLSAMFELPTMRYSEQIAGVIGGSACLLIAYGLFAIAYLGYAISPNPLIMLAFSLSRGFAYGLFYTSTIRLLSRRAPPEWTSTLQGIMNALAFGLAQLISRPLGGIIYDTLGPPMVFFVAASTVVTGMILMGSAMALGLARP